MLLFSPQLHSSSTVSTRDALVEQSKVLATTFSSKVSLLETPGTLSGKEQELTPLCELQAISELKICKCWQKSSYCESHHILSVVTGSLWHKEFRILLKIYFTSENQWDSSN